MKFSWWGLALLVVLVHLGLVLWAVRQDLELTLWIAGLSVWFIAPYVLNSEARKIKLLACHIFVTGLLSAYSAFWLWFLVHTGQGPSTTLWGVPFAISLIATPFAVFLFPVLIFFDPEELAKYFE